MPPAFRKQHRAMPPDYFRWEAAGLRWLADAGGAAVVEVLHVGRDHLDLVRIETTGPTPGAAADLGAALAVTHDAGAPAYGSPPPGWSGDGYLGPLGDPLPLPLAPTPTWGAVQAEHRIRPLAALGGRRGVFGAHERAIFDRLADRLDAGLFDDDDRPARLHGDLWFGNVMWSARGAVLIDPAAFGGHRESDLAMLALFGCPHLEHVRAGYREAHPLTPGWADRVLLHQVHPLMVHAVLFGGGYIAQSVAAAAHYG